MFYAVIDTNVLVSSLITEDDRSPTMAVLRAIKDKKITPVYSAYLLDEYREVLSRDKFKVSKESTTLVMELFTKNGICFEPETKSIVLPDMDDAPIYLIAMQTRSLDSYLVTGNKKHYPDVDYVVTPRKMIEIMNTR